MNIPSFDEIANSKAHRAQKYIKNRYPEFFEYLVNHFNDSWASTSELLYRYFNHIEEKPKCKVCGSVVTFKDFNSGYHQYCGKKCLNNDPELVKQMAEKRKRTNLERYGYECNLSDPNHQQKIREILIEKYGVDNPQKSKEIREKTKQTCLEKYGVECITQSPIMQEKTKQTCLEKYGVEYIGQSKEAQEKAKHSNLERYGGTGFESKELLEKTRQTNLERYGNIIPQKTAEISSKISSSKRVKTFQKFPFIEEINGEMVKCKCPNELCNLCTEKSYIVNINVYQQRLRLGMDPCIIRHPLKCISGTSLELFIRSILDDHKINYETNNRTILDGKELDIYIPEYKLAIECNGVYWHSLKEPKYHFTKWKQCNEQGIQLLTIWEDQIINKPEIIKNIILSKLGIYEHSIGARECTIKEATNSETHEFLSMYHLQGPVSGSVRLGLYYKDELVSLMVFGRKRTALGNKKHDTWELYRYCTKAGWSVTGGSQKLLSHFIGLHPDTILESFSSNDISIGTLYKKLGFELESVQPGSYWYIDKEMNRHHRYSFRKDVLVKNGANPNLTEFEITTEMGLFRIYDSGQQKWILNINP